jgi:hypothetical protein
MLASPNLLRIKSTSLRLKYVFLLIQIIDDFEISSCHSHFSISYQMIICVVQNRTVKPPCSLRRRTMVSRSSSSPSKAKNLLLVRLWVFPSQRAPPIPHNHLCKAKLLNRQIKMSVIATVFQISFPSLGEVGQEFDVLNVRNIILDGPILSIRLRVDLSVSLRRHLEDSLATFLVCESVVIRGRRQCQVRLLM